MPTPTLPLTATPTSASSVPPTIRLEERFQIEFVATKAFMKKLEKARSLLSNRLDGMSFERVFEALLDEFLDRHSPEKKQERREKRAEKRSESNSEKRGEKSSEKVSEKSSRKIQGPARPREGATEARVDGPVSEATRDAVYLRDGGRCTYVGTTGQRCNSTHHLQIDHVVPRGRGGTNALGNLRLLCGMHNRLEAERIYGANVMRKYIPRE
jgi:5-methylcytosine-specific restriction endonuclease McrA